MLLLDSILIQSIICLNLSPMIAVREEQHDKGEVYPLNGIEQLVINHRLRDMSW